MAQTADLLITHAQVLTQNPQQPRAEAVAIRGNRIVFVGEAAEAGAWRGPGTRVVDAQQATVLPGFIDSHFHLLWGAMHLANAQLREAATPAAVADTLRAYAAAHPALAGVQGRGLRYEVITGREQLDAILPDRPVLVTAYDGHTAWANTRALELAGLLRGGAPNGPNGVIVRDAHGLATGELREAGAIEPVRALFPEPDEAQQRALLIQAIRQINAAGVTSVHNMDGTLDQLALYAGMEDRGELNLRVYVPFHVKPETTRAAMLEEAAAMKAIQGELARGGAAKFFMDGVLESWTALMVDPYADLADSHGEALFSAEHFLEMAAAADQLGLQIAVHCCGDGAVRRTLDGYAAIQQRHGRRDSRHRVEHVEVVHPADVPRFAALGVIASMQTVHCPPNILGEDVWPTRAGEARWPHSFAWRTLKNAGAVLANGSDWFVAPFNPMLGLDAALNRQPWAPGHPDQRLTLAEALASYTRDAAYTEFKEQEKGQLAPGFAADVVVLDADLTRTASEGLRDVKPVLTVMDGRVVHEG